MKKLALTALSAALLTGCFGDDSSNDSNTVDTDDIQGHIFIAQLISGDYKTSEIAIGTVGESEFVENYASQDASDYTIDVYEQYLYHIGRFNIDTLTRYDAAADFLQADYTYSLAEAESSSSNTHQFVQVAEDKAYVIRYGKTSIQIVDPSAVDEQNFVIGEIELSEYVAEDATYPRMTRALVHEDKLFVGLQRLGNADSSYAVASDSYVAVIDIATNTEIDTNESAPGLKGIQLNADNLKAMAIEDDYLYVAGRGDYSDNSGALDRISLSDYSVDTLIDGSTFAALNDVDSGAYYHVQAVEVVDDTLFVQINLEGGEAPRGYIYSAPISNPANFTDVTPEAFAGEKIAVIQSGPDDTLWVSLDNVETPDVYVLNESAEVQGEALEFSMPVREIEFMEIQD
ncbi:hypothetical protein SAMN05421686_104309 [Thalassolituus maritimus]|uniref:DUF4374 domain-containing protein n=1 Tax=Thalassolituus maritimus TaxID=484498 RepID=A0A1N7LYV6_9GAMM|nr:hypothetical protein [Thalassolituus maritimus]SIS78992.1 hypothetical protein SAMN05421686_104309 [Thalassolituus maritimus]